VTQNIVDIGDIFGGIGSAPLPTANTQFVYKSGATGNIVVSFEDTQGVDVQLNKEITQAGDHKFLVTSRARAATNPPSSLSDDKIEFLTYDGTTKIHSFRQTNGSDYGAGKVEIETNTGGIAIKSNGNNVNGNATPGLEGGPINVIGTDCDINISTGRLGDTNRHIHTRFIGGQTGPKGLVQPMNSSILVCAEAPSSIVASGDISTVTQGGQINLITRRPTGLIESGPITLVTENDNIDLIAGTTGGTGKKITAKSKLEVQTSASTTTIDLDGSSDGVVTVGTTAAGSFGGNIKVVNTNSGSGTAGYAVRIGSDATNESGRVQLTNNSDQVTMDINGGDSTGNSQPYIRLGDFIGTGSGKDLYMRSLQSTRACIEGITSQNTMIIESNGGSSTGGTQHGQMIFSSAGTSGSTYVTKIERSIPTNQLTPTLQMLRPFRLWNASNTIITDPVTGLTQTGDMAYDTTTDCVKYRSNSGSILCLASSDQRILRVVQGSESLAKNYNSAAATTSWSGVILPAPAYSGSGSGPVPLGPAGPPSIIGTIRSGTTFTNASQSGTGTPAIQSAPGLGSEDCNIIYLGTAGQPGQGNIIPADGTPNFRPVLCCKCMLPERISATPTDLEYSLLVSGNLNIWAHQSSSTPGSDRINFSLGVFATLADSIGVPNGGAGNSISDAEKRNNPYTGAPNNGGAAGTAYNANYVSIIGGSDKTINGTGGGIGGLGTWPRPLHSSYYTNLTQTGNNGPTSGTGDAYRYASVGTFTNGTWEDPLGFTPGTPATGGGWGDALKGDSYQDTPQEAQGNPRSGTMSVPFNLLCNNPNLDYNTTTSAWSKGPEREIYLWLCLGFNAGGNWDWLQVAKNGFGNSGNPGASNSPFFGANSMKVTYLGAAAAASSGASSDA
jgi:hypothetical protein